MRVHSLSLPLGLACVCPALFGQAKGDDELRKLMEQAPRALPAHERTATRAVDALEGKGSDALREAMVDFQGPGDGAKALSDGATIPVMATATSDDATARVVEQITKAGGKSVHAEGRIVLARLQPAAIKTVAASKDIAYLTTQPVLSGMSQQNQPPTEADALGLMEIASLHQAGYKGDGVKVGIIDFGFEGYEKLRQKGLVPTPVAVKIFSEEARSIENGDIHGAACAEIIHAASPGAKLYLAVIDGSPSALGDAADWIRSQGVQIVSFSGGSVETELRGGDAMSRMVDRQVREDGRLWVVSAGNSGDHHWALSAQKADANGWLQFGAVGEVLLPIRTGEIDKGNFGVTVAVNWDDWSASGNQSGQDIDACVFLIPSVGEKPREVKCSEERQSENSSVRPLEVIRLKGEGFKNQVLYLGLKKVRLTHPVRVHIFVKTDLAKLPEIAPGSVSSPGTAQLSLTVGAYDLSDKSLADYSSTGPTDDGRIKPDVIAPSGAYSAAYGAEFDGTSASCPFVAGFSAVLAGMFPNLRGADLRQKVIETVTPLGRATPNNFYGYGFVTASALLKKSGGSPGAGGGGAPKTSGAAVDGVPAAWGGPVPVSVLEKLREMPASTWVGQTKVVTGRDRYKVGDGLKFGIRADRDSSYLLFYRSASGEFEFLLPSDGDNGVMSAGERYVIPGGNHTLTVKEGMVGEPELLLITASQPVDWRKWSPQTLTCVALTRFQVSR